jgi:hypothetical protein
MSLHRPHAVISHSPAVLGKALADHVFRLAVWMRDLLGVCDDLEGLRQSV